MNKPYYIFFILIVSFTFQVKAQEMSIPKMSKSPTCYQRTFDYNELSKLIKVDCDEIAKLRNDSREQVKTEEELITLEQEKIKFTKYQERLIGLGYKLIATGCMDKPTADAHNKYLKKKKRAEKKRLKVKIEHKD